MHIDLYISMAGLLVGFVVGLTGMGGGALMTPVLVIFFGVQPLAAVSSDLVAAVVMKPVGGFVHLRRGTVNRNLVKWLCMGSVPGAFAGVLVLKSFGNGEVVQTRLQYCLGATLLLATGTMVAKAYLGVRRNSQERRGLVRPTVFVPEAVTSIEIHPVRTVLIGVLGGLVVGMTSVGSGSLIIVLMLVMYPSLQAGQLVGTDLVQAVPLVASAALGHLIFGDFQFGLTTSLLIGSVPGVYLGARVSAQAPGRLVRRALMVVLFASGLKLATIGNVGLLIALGACVIVAPVGWMLLRRAHGLPARVPTPSHEGRERSGVAA
jgi:uncharacterized membrane protein YfcA